MSSQGISIEEPKSEDMELIRDTKEMLEATNARLLSDLTTIDQEVMQYEGAIFPISYYVLLSFNLLIMYLLGHVFSGF